MAQFQVYQVYSGRLVLDLQTDLLDSGSRVVGNRTVGTAA